MGYVRKMGKNNADCMTVVDVVVVQKARLRAP